MEALGRGAEGAGLGDGQEGRELVGNLDAFLDTNLNGTYFTTQAAVPALVERGGGAVVNVGTVLVEQPMQGLPASAAMAAKGGVHAQYLAVRARHFEGAVRSITPIAAFARGAEAPARPG